MKRILITGENSYIGGKFTEWVAQWPDQYHVDEISVRGDKWKEVDFSNFDVILHVAAVVHKKETKQNVDLYYKVNRDLAYEVAKKAKDEGVAQFILMSTMNVYGLSNGAITKNTPCNPESNYGKSKYEAEQLITNLQTKNYNVAIIRPPMVYGPNTNGNYKRLSKLIKLTPIFPKIGNKRSMIFIDNLSEFIRFVIEKKLQGIFFPQNKEYVSTFEIAKNISFIHNHSLKFTTIFNPIIKYSNWNVCKKMFGDLFYEKNMSEFIGKYQTVGFKESIKKTEATINEGT